MVQNSAYKIDRKLPKRGDFEDVEIFNGNLISIVYTIRVMVNYIKAEKKKSALTWI